MPMQKTFRAETFGMLTDRLRTTRCEGSGGVIRGTSGAFVGCAHRGYHW